MSEIQEILNKVIASGHYQGLMGSRFMCWSLERAWEARIITLDERLLATNAIEEYIAHIPFSTLSAALNCSDKPFLDEDCLAVYKDWENRPVLTGNAYY